MSAAVVVTFVLDPPVDAPDDWERVEVRQHWPNLDQAVLMLGGVGAPTVVPKLRLDGYASWRSTYATIEVGRTVVATVSDDGWEPYPIDDETFLDLLDIGHALRSSVRDASEQVRLAWLMAHTATPSGAVPWLCEDCAGDDDCAYRAVVAIIGKLGR